MFSTFQLAQFADQLLFGTIAIVALVLWAGFAMAVAYIPLKLMANAVGALWNAVRGKAAASESEPGLAPKKAKKAVAAPAPMADAEPVFTFDDAEEMEAAATAVARAPRVTDEKSEASTALADRLADEFDGQPVTA